MNKVLGIALVVMAISACTGGSIADEEHTVDEYYNDAKLSSATIEACRGRNAAERRSMAEKPACRNVAAAEKRRASEEWREAVGEME